MTPISFNPFIGLFSIPDMKIEFPFFAPCIVTNEPDPIFTLLQTYLEYRNYKLISIRETNPIFRNALTIEYQLKIESRNKNNATI